MQTSLPCEKLQMTQTYESDFRRRLQQASADDLIAAFNREVGNEGCTSTRAGYLTELRTALLATGLDCSAFISDVTMNLSHAIERKGDAIVLARRGSSGTGGSPSDEETELQDLGFTEDTEVTGVGIIGGVANVMKGPSS
jgi:hypothetical protein